MRILVVAPQGLADLLARFLARGKTAALPVGTVAEASLELGHREPDLVLLHLLLPDDSGLLLCAGLVRAQPARPVLLLAPRPTPHLAALAALAGARGVWHLSDGLDSLHERIRLVSQGRSCFDGPGVMLNTSRLHTPFTPRRVEVLGCLGAGLSRQQIASALGITVNTVDDHLLALHQTLGVRTTAALVALAAEVGIVAPPCHTAPGEKGEKGEKGEIRSRREGGRRDR